MDNFLEIFKNLDMDQLQGSTDEMRKKLTNIQEEGEAGVGLVRVTMNGDYKILSCAIEDSLLNKESKRVLGDLLAAAVNNAIEKIKDRTKDLALNTFMGMFQNILAKEPPKIT